jgi:hypothetical protein
LHTESTFPSAAVTSLRVLHGAQCDSSFLSSALGPAAGGRDVWEDVSLSTYSRAGEDIEYKHWRKPCLLQRSPSRANLTLN